MEVRGERECQSCGNRWSYYETGQITCPECGSVRSVGLDEPTEHTATDTTLDVTAVQANVGEKPLRNLAKQAADLAREYTAKAGFIDAGELQPLDDTVLVAAELRRVGATLGHVMQIADEEELYFLELLRSANGGDRPDSEAVPETLAPERGLAVTASVDAYLTDFRRAFPDRERSVTNVLSSVRTHRKRIEALDGDVDPAEAEQLVRTVRDLSDYVREDDETALSRALERL
jgi:uncharacterized Zn finger protein (UPF0148 family)